MKHSWKFSLLLISLLVPAILTSRTIWEHEAWDGIIEKAVFSVDATRVACAMEDGRILVREMETGEVLLEQSATLNSISCVDISSDGQRVVWGDVSGMLYSWSPEDGVVSQSAGDMSLSGLALSRDGANAFVMGDGVQLRIRDTSDLHSVYLRSLNLEQVHALSVDSTANLVLAGDHSGQVIMLDRSTGTKKSKAVFATGLAGGSFLTSGSAEAAIWDWEGNLLFIDSSLNELGSFQLGDETVECVAEDSDSERLLIATSGGDILAVNLTELEMSMVANLARPAVGLGVKEDGSIHALDMDGTVWRISGDTVQVYRAPFAIGQTLRADLLLQSGMATLMTNKGGWIGRLSDGYSWPISTEANDVLLDVAIFHGISGDCPVQLVLDSETLNLRLTGDCLPEEIIIDDWTPTRVACGAWQPRIALMSSDGEVLMIEEQGDGLVELYSDNPSSGLLWEDLTLTDNDREIVKTNGRTSEMIPALDGPFSLKISSAGYIQLTSDESDPVFDAYPDLMPALNGGMDTGFFGNILAIRDSWIRHREFGWGFLFPRSGTSWCWFQNEGWLVADLAYYPFLYSPTRENWLYYLVSEHSTDWVYDYAVSAWRPFASGL